MRKKEIERERRRGKERERAREIFKSDGELAKRGESEEGIVIAENT